MTWYKFAGHWYEAYKDDPSTYAPLVDAMMGFNLLGKELEEFVNGKYDSPYEIIETMIDYSADRLLDEILDEFVDEMTLRFDAVCLPHMEAVQEEEP